MEPLTTYAFRDSAFSPDGDTVFVNLYGDSTGSPADHAGEGMTCAITGPWRKGPL